MSVCSIAKYIFESEEEKATPGGRLLTHDPVLKSDEILQRTALHFYPERPTDMNGTRYCGEVD